MPKAAGTAALAPETADEAVGKLTEEERDVLRACVLAQMSVAGAVGEDVIALQVNEARSPRVATILASFAGRGTPLVNPRGPSLWGFTRHGAVVAHQVVAEDAEVEPEVPIGYRAKRIRGNPRDEMKAYAEQVGGVYDPGRGRCNFDAGGGHESTHFVRRGAMRLCQTCFQMGKRPWPTA